MRLFQIGRVGWVLTRLPNRTKPLELAATRKPGCPALVLAPPLQQLTCASSPQQQDDRRGQKPQARNREPHLDPVPISWVVKERNEPVTEEEVCKRRSWG